MAARSLAALGIDLGKNLAPPMPGNPKGFFEDMAFVRIHIALLNSLGLKWHSLEEISPEPLTDAASGEFGERARNLLQRRMSLYSSFGFKDPRLCRLLPFWRAIVDRITGDVGCVVVARNPMAVAHSLTRRNNFSLEHGVELWHLHMKPLVGPIHAGWRKITVEYDRLLEQPEEQLHRIASALNLVPPQRLAVETFCNEFINVSLRHNLAGIIHAAPLHVRRTWDELQRQSLLN
ncbi:MAG TPA: hypothetical protein VHT03_09190 [Rhizomicrobium sp.]|nr:hypothetical protein [Rhizomicrobium sp.]